MRNLAPRIEAAEQSEPFEPLLLDDSETLPADLIDDDDDDDYPGYLDHIVAPSEPVSSWKVVGRFALVLTILLAACFAAAPSIYFFVLREPESEFAAVPAREAVGSAAMQATRTNVLLPRPSPTAEASGKAVAEAIPPPKAPAQRPADFARAAALDSAGTFQHVAPSPIDRLSPALTVSAARLVKAEVSSHPTPTVTSAAVTSEAERGVLKPAATATGVALAAVRPPVAQPISAPALSSSLPLAQNLPRVAATTLAGRVSPPMLAARPSGELSESRTPVLGAAYRIAVTAQAAPVNPARIAAIRPTTVIAQASADRLPGAEIAASPQAVGIPALTAASAAESALDSLAAEASGIAVAKSVPEAAQGGSLDLAAAIAPPNASRRARPLPASPSAIAAIPAMKVAPPVVVWRELDPTASFPDPVASVPAKPVVIASVDRFATDVPLSWLPSNDGLAAPERLEPAPIEREKAEPAGAALLPGMLDAGAPPLVVGSLPRQDAAVDLITPDPALPIQPGAVQIGREGLLAPLPRPRPAYSGEGQSAALGTKPASRPPSGRAPVSPERTIERPASATRDAAARASRSIQDRPSAQKAAKPQPAAASDTKAGAAKPTTSGKTAPTRAAARKAVTQTKAVAPRPAARSKATPPRQTSATKKAAEPGRVSKPKRTKPVDRKPRQAAPPSTPKPQRAAPAAQQPAGPKPPALPAALLPTRPPKSGK